MRLIKSVLLFVVLLFAESVSAIDETSDAYQIGHVLGKIFMIIVLLLIIKKIFFKKKH